MGSDTRLHEVFGAKLAAWRKKNGRPLKDVASSVGGSISIVSEWEHGARFPSAKNLQAVAEMMGMPVWKVLKSDMRRG